MYNEGMENTIITVYPDGRKESRPMTEDEIAQRDMDMLLMKEKEDEMILQEEQREISIQSAKSKLSALGLTEDEVNALLGNTGV